MEEYSFIDGLQGYFLQPETRRFLAVEKLKLTVEMHRNQEIKDRERETRANLTTKLVASGHFTVIECEFFSVGTLHFLVTKLDK